MNNRLVPALLAAAVLSLAACSKGPDSQIGLVDVQRLTSNWPKFLNYQNQLNSDVTALQQSHAPDTQKQRQFAVLQQKYAQNQGELTNDVRDAAVKIAQSKGLKYVVTRQFVGYGGVDITPDVEKELNITEKATPAP